MGHFFETFLACCSSLIFVSLVFAIVQIIAKKRVEKTTQQLKTMAYGRLEKLINQIENPDHRKKAEENLRAAFEGQNVAAAQEVTSKILDYLKAQKQPEPGKAVT